MHSQNFLDIVTKPWKNKEKLKLYELFGIIPLLNIITIGYVLESTKYAEQYILPPWNRKWHYFTTGLAAIVISASYYILISILAWFLDFIPGFELAMAILYLYLLPNALINYINDGWKAAYTQFNVFNPKYLTAYIKGLIWSAVVTIPIYLVRIRQKGY